MTAPRVSIILPTYNRAAFLAQAFESIRAPSPGGSARTRFPASPPPVMWAAARTPPPPTTSSTAGA